MNKNYLVENDRGLDKPARAPRDVSKRIRNTRVNLNNIAFNSDLLRAKLLLDGPNQQGYITEPKRAVVASSYTNNTNQVKNARGARYDGYSLERAK